MEPQGFMPRHDPYDLERIFGLTFEGEHDVCYHDSSEIDNEFLPMTKTCLSDLIREALAAGVTPERFRQAVDALLRDAGEG